ncbi:MAG: ABC transporter permease [Clostridia bacterium]|nr:ABC transporter permease [Clostridia bacterium]
MLKFALKNMLIKKVQIILIVLSIVISAGVGVLAYNVANQVSDGITSNAGYYSAIIGPSGSATQLAMNTMYFTDDVLGTIPYSIVEDLQADTRVATVIPYSMADNYKGYAFIGTTTDYFEGKTLASGDLFNDDALYEVVVGAEVARAAKLKIGDIIHSQHSQIEGDEHEQGYTVVGILNESHSMFDNVLFTQFKTIWAVHEEEHEHEHEEEEEEEHDHEEMGGMVCAILVKATNPSTAMQLVNDYDGKIVYDEDGDSFTLQAIEPMSTVRGVLKDTDSTKYIVYILCGIILAMNIMVISIITLLNMYNSAKEISLMRLIGIGMGKINLLYIIENSIIGFISTALAFGVSRLCLTFVQDYVKSMGVVLNMAKIYPFEWLILLGIFLISVIPTVICTVVMSKKDSISD